MPEKQKKLMTDGTISADDGRKQSGFEFFGWRAASANASNDGSSEN